MTTYTVNTPDDVVDGNYGQLSLREAVNLANTTIAADTIEFAPLIEGQTLVLSGGELTVSQDLRINGEGVTLDAAGSSRLLNIGSGVDVTLNSLTLANGRVDEGPNFEAENGAGIYLGSFSNLTMTSCTIRDCQALDAYGGGGDIFADYRSKLALTGCSILRNSTGQNGFGYGDGAGILAQGNVELKIYSSRISDNLTPAYGGGISAGSGSTLLLAYSVN
jgi:fibronectin-binding autotransporter adhesin